MGWVGRSNGPKLQNKLGPKNPIWSLLGTRLSWSTTVLAPSRDSGSEMTEYEYASLDPSSPKPRRCRDDNDLDFSSPVDEVTCFRVTYVWKKN